MLWVPWQLVHVGAEPWAAPLSALPWILSWNLLSMLPPGNLAWATTASLPWHFEHVASRLAWLVRDSEFFDRLMSWVPWQSVQVAATTLPPVRANPCTVPAYSVTALTWKVAQ